MGLTEQDEITFSDGGTSDPLAVHEGSVRRIQVCEQEAVCRVLKRGVLREDVDGSSTTRSFSGDRPIVVIGYLEATSALGEEHSDLIARPPDRFGS